MLSLEQTDDLFKLYLKAKDMKSEKELDKLFLDFPDRLQKIIFEKGYTYTELTHKMPVSYGQIQRWCDGVSRPDMRRLMALANTLEIGIDELIGLKPLSSERPYGGDCDD